MKLVDVADDDMAYTVTITIKSVAVDNDGTGVKCSDATDTIRHTVSVYGMLSLILVIHNKPITQSPLLNLSSIICCN